LRTLAVTKLCNSFKRTPSKPWLSPRFSEENVGH
jgi:hypothetical protein